MYVLPHQDQSPPDLLLRPIGKAHTYLIYIGSHGGRLPRDPPVPEQLIVALSAQAFFPEHAPGAAEPDEQTVLGAMVTHGVSVRRRGRSCCYKSAIGDGGSGKYRSGEYKKKAA